jgi:replicative DNA helicase
LKEIETLILGGLTTIPDYAIRVVPFIKDKYFQDDANRILFRVYQEYYDKYKTIPKKEAIAVEVESLTGISLDTHQKSIDRIETIYSSKIQEAIRAQNLDWLFDRTQKYLTDRACFLAVMEAIDILDGSSKDKNLTKAAIPDILKQALSIEFNTHFGHDYIDDAEARYESYHSVDSLLPFSLTMMNRCTDGGIPPKTLIVPLALTGGGKSIFLTDQAAFNMTSGKNVLYISLEMAETRLAQRVDAKLFDVEVNQVKRMSKDSFMGRINDIRKKTCGKFILKEYAPGSFHANHLRALLNDLKSKTGFVPDVIMVDYIGLMASYRIRSNDSSYGYLKAVAEELRGVAIEHNVPIIAPHQTNRSAVGMTDLELDAVADSHGISMTADLIFAIISTDELEQAGMCRIKMLKNRFGPPNVSFVVGLNKAKMQFYDVDVAPEGQAAPQKMPAKEQPKMGLKFG